MEKTEESKSKNIKQLNNYHQLFYKNNWSPKGRIEREPGRITV